jgi:enediyne polyketide synthase
LSAAHHGDLTLVVAGDGPLGCDLEAVEPRSPAAWRGLLGDGGLALARRIAGDTGEDEAVAATRVWSAVESLLKAGRPANEPLTLAPRAADAEEGWVVLEAGGLPVATFATSLRGEPASVPIVVAVLARGCDR